MKFEIGKIIKFDKDSPLVINFPGIGVVKSCREEINGNLFDYVILNMKQLKKLKNRIQKELENTYGKESNME